jgi:thiamine biosynthesis lipoprotein
MGIRDPRDWGVIASVELHGGESLHTSGNYERFVEADGVRYSHILDPHTGMPVDHLVSVSVIDNDSALADAAATAITVAGPHAWVQVAKRMGVSQVMVVDKLGTIYVSPKMLARLQFKTDKTFKIVTTESLSQETALSHLRQSSDVTTH